MLPFIWSFIRGTIAPAITSRVAGQLPKSEVDNRRRYFHQIFVLIQVRLLLSPYLSHSIILHISGYKSLP